MHLVVADFHAEPAEFAAAAAATLPRLPGLELIGRYGGRRSLPPDWRAFVARCAGRPELADVAPAQVAAAALDLPADARPWLAVPVHLTAGIDHLRLHPAGLLNLDARESVALCGSFTTEFAASGLSLQPLFGSLLLVGLGPVVATTQDPAAFLGADMATAPATGRDAPVLRRLGSEIEMWLHDHPVNRRRVQQGRLPVSGLWLWGGTSSASAALPLRQRSLALPLGYADDGYVAGLWHLSGGETAALPATFAALLADPGLQRGARAAIIVLSAAATGPRDLPLLRLEAAWFEPAVRHLRAGGLARLSVFLGGQQWGLSSAGMLRCWRRARPWWDYFRA